MWILGFQNNAVSVAGFTGFLWTEDRFVKKRFEKYTDSCGRNISWINFFSFNPCESLPTVRTDDRTRFQCLKLDHYFSNRRFQKYTDSCGRSLSWLNFFRFQSTSILAIRDNRWQETVSMPEYDLKKQNWTIFFRIQLMHRQVLTFYEYSK